MRIICYKSHKRERGIFSFANDAAKIQKNSNISIICPKNQKKSDKFASSNFLMRNIYKNIIN